MSDENGSLASAFLDDELPPETRASVEHALAADPSLAEEVRSLGLVRDLVAALPRPTSPDFSGAVLKRIVAPRPRVIAAPVSRPMWIVATAAGLLAIAFGLAASFRSRNLRVDSPPPMTQSSIVPQPEVPILVGETAVDPGPMGPPASLATPLPPPAVGEADRAVAALGLLGRPGTHRVFLVSTQDDAIDTDETAALLEVSSHRNFLRLDPPASDQASGEPRVVFAAELDPSELATLRRRLSGAFTGRIDEVEAEPQILMRLARVGQVTTLKGEPAGEVLFPQYRMALQSAAVVGSSADSPGGGRTEGGMPSGPAASAEVAPQSDARSSIIQVWLVHPVDH